MWTGFQRGNGSPFGNPFIPMLYTLNIRCVVYTNSTFTLFKFTLLFSKWVVLIYYRRQWRIQAMDWRCSGQRHWWADKRINALGTTNGKVPAGAHPACYELNTRLFRQSRRNIISSLLKFKKINNNRSAYAERKWVFITSLSTYAVRHSISAPPEMEERGGKGGTFRWFPQAPSNDQRGNGSPFGNPFKST